ncbi:ABC transporter ATP-binding protein [Ruegeria sp.]|uniref:ABC transporter ATP-binding protein n=1 Tax=Ruegeria sp. TaxID=1879320 RepID=UPI003C7E175A
MLLTIDHVSKSYPGGRPVLSEVSLNLDQGETLALTGESGSGKSTLLHLAAALDGFDGGEITLDGTAISNLDDTGRAALRRITLSLVFQQFNLIPSLTVQQNLSIHARLADREDPEWTATLAERLGLAELLQRYPEQLSGGQQQRVAIGRAMATRPKLLLADEPTGNLDETASAVVLDLMLSLVAETGAALLLVTHSQDIAARLDRRAHLSGGRIT